MGVGLTIRAHCGVLHAGAALYVARVVMSEKKPCKQGVRGGVWVGGSERAIPLAICTCRGRVACRFCQCCRQSTQELKTPENVSLQG